MSLKEAIDEFPIVSWLSGITEFRDTGGDNLVLPCPVCGKKKLSVHRVKKLAHCWRCAEGGHGGDTWSGKVNLIGLIALLERSSISEAFNTLYELSGVPETYRPTKLAVPDEIFPDNCFDLNKVRDNHPAVKYLERRGVGHLRSVAKINMDEHRYSGRILLPCYWRNELVGIEAKSYCGDVPKSLYDSWFLTGKYLYTSSDFHINKGYVVLVESVLDAETVRHNALGCYGSSLKEGQLVKLLELRKEGIKKIIFFWDGDAFEKQSRALVAKTLPFFDNYVAKLSVTEDPNEIGYDRCQEVIEKAVLINNEFDLLYLSGDY